jgi:phosphatidylserine/phosphatidylglycerophosphate/cardiolipin synthase-like enzyme
MRVLIPAWHYRARVIVQRAWGWSPVEELVLLHLDASPGTMETVRARLGLRPQVVGATLARLMQFGLVELRASPEPLLSTSPIARQFLRSGRPLPERTAEREVSVSLVYEPVGRSMLRRRDVDLQSPRDAGSSDAVVQFERGEAEENEETMAARVGDFLSGALRPGEWLRGVRAVSSRLSRQHLVIDLADVRAGLFPKGASEQFVAAFRTSAATGVPPLPLPPEPKAVPTVETRLAADDLIVGAVDHLDRFEAIVDRAKKDVFVLSTFVAAQNDPLGRERRDRLLDSLARAVKRGVRCHLFFGTSLDKDLKHAAAMEEVRLRLAADGSTRGFLLVHRDPVRSHAKFLVADDGEDGVTVVVGSCNWLHSPFSAVEVSVELKESAAAALGIDLLRAIVVSLPDAKRSVEILRILAADLRRASQAAGSRPGRSLGSALTRLTLVYAADHERLLRRAAHEARTRFVCCTNRLGAGMVPLVFRPAEVAGRRLADVRVLYSRRAKPVSRGRVAAVRDGLQGAVDVIGVRDPQLHCKFLLWDDDHVVVSTLNWGSQTGSDSEPLDEVGVHLEAPGLATKLLERVEALIKTANG